MPSVTFDTLAFSRRLRQAGMPAGQADAFAEAQKAAIDEAVAARDLVTKRDLEKSGNALLRWMAGMLLAQTALVVTAIGLAVFMPAR